MNHTYIWKILQNKKLFIIMKIFKNIKNNQIFINNYIIKLKWKNNFKFFQNKFIQMKKIIIMSFNNKKIYYKIIWILNNYLQNIINYILKLSKLLIIKILIILLLDNFKYY